MRVKDYNKEQILKAQKEEKEELGEQIFILARSYVTKFNKYKLNREDTEQELFLEVWANLEEFDDTKANFSTFAYLLFHRRMNRLLRQQNKINALCYIENVELLEDTIKKEFKKERKK